MFHEHQRTLGVAHISSLSAAFDYTETTFLLGYLKDASQWAVWVFGTGSSALGPKHPLVLKVNRIRGEVLLYRGELQKAEDLLGGTFVDQQDSLGSDHPDTLETERALGHACHTMGRIQDAEARLRHRLEETTRRLGENHIKVSAAAIDLVRATLPASSNALGTIGQFQQAAMVIDDVHRRLRASFGPQHQLTIRALRVYGHVKLLQGETTEATDMLRRALSNAEALLGRDHPETIEVVALMVLLHSGSGFPQLGGLGSPAMRGWCERYTTWLEQRLGLDIPETRSMLNVLALSHMQESNYVEAEKYYERLVRSYQGMNSKESQEANNMYQLCRMNTGLLRGQAFGGGGGQGLADVLSRLGLFRN
jgi:tetratricopeptide (TPR) repeat protein